MSEPAPDQFGGYSDDRGRDAYATAVMSSTRGASPPTKNEKMHMRPTNNFEDITEEEFDRRERAKAEYRRELQEQMDAQNAAKEAQKKKLLVSDLNQEKKIYRQLQDM